MCRAYEKRPRQGPFQVPHPVGAHLRILDGLYRQREQFLPYLKDTELWKEARALEDFSIADRLIPCWRYIGRKKMIHDIFYYAHHHQNDAYKGFKSYNKSWDGRTLASIKQLNYPMHKSVIRKFESFLKECKGENIPVVFVYVPFYIEATQKTPDLKGIQGTFGKLAEKYGCEVLDYRMWGSK